MKRFLISECGLEVFSPRIRYCKKRGSQVVLAEEALFPGYVFAKFVYFIDCRRVRAGKGVLNIVAFGGRPAEVRERIISDLRSQLSDDEILELESGVSEGILIQIVDGPFSGTVARVTRMIPATHRVALLMNILGSEQEIEHSTDQVLVGLEHPLIRSHLSLAVSHQTSSTLLK